MNSQSSPAITAAPADGKLRPFWSVMMPVFNPPPGYLEQALRSVLQAGIDPDNMEIEVIDHASTTGEVAALVRRIAGDRVRVHREPVNQGLCYILNRCIERANGELVHILHHDDYVLPGFYSKLSAAAANHPEVGLLASRCFFVDEQSIVSGVTARLMELEVGGKAVESFFYAAPLQCPGVVVRRTVYEKLGGFRPDLIFALDNEMWVRIISSAGGLVLPEILACYRVSGSNESSRLHRTAESWRDLDRMYQIFAGRYPALDLEKARGLQSANGRQFAERYEALKDHEAAQANWDYWRQITPFKLRLRHYLGRLVRKII